MWAFLVRSWHVLLVTAWAPSRNSSIFNPKTSQNSTIWRLGDGWWERARWNLETCFIILFEFFRVHLGSDSSGEKREMVAWGVAYGLTRCGTQQAKKKLEGNQTEPALNRVPFPENNVWSCTPFIRAHWDNTGASISGSWLSSQHVSIWTAAFCQKFCNV